MTDINGPYADTAGMFRVHAMFRREFGAAPSLVRGVDGPAAGRRELVAEHTGFMLRLLEIHHHGEDEVLWPRLLERAASQTAPLIHLMERQHESLAAEIAASTAQLAEWSATGAAQARERLAASLERLDTAVNEHMSAEEQRVLPLVEMHILATEWDEMVRRGAVQLTAAERARVAGIMARASAV